MVETFKRHRGGQPGNKNAVKHGFYSRNLNKAELLDYIHSAGIPGIEEELKMIHHELSNIAHGGGAADLSLLLKGLAVLEKMLFVSREISAVRNQRLKDAIATVMKDVMPVGIEKTGGGG
jgi:hypothetical protein